MQTQQLTSELLDTAVFEIDFYHFKQILEEQGVETSFSPVECFYAAAVYFGATLDDCLNGNLVDTGKYQFEYGGDTIFCSTDSQAYNFAGEEMTGDDEDEVLEIFYGDFARINIEQLRKEIGNSADFVDEEKYVQLMHYNNTGSDDLSDLWLDYKFGEVVDSVLLNFQSAPYKQNFDIRKL